MLGLTCLPTALFPVCSLCRGNLTLKNEFSFKANPTPEDKEAGGVRLMGNTVAGAVHWCPHMTSSLHRSHCPTGLHHCLQLPDPKGGTQHMHVDQAQAPALPVTPFTWKDPIYSREEPAPQLSLFCLWEGQRKFVFYKLLAMSKASLGSPSLSGLSWIP
jgi:hypothetical protein